ncbi:MAG TPA: hypothetical protein VMQ38_04245 [Mycobacterium sp.]|nr:hypothetical protein [Mycobacterium sp.]
MGSPGAQELAQPRYGHSSTKGALLQAAIDDRMRRITDEGSPIKRSSRPG